MRELETGEIEPRHVPRLEGGDLVFALERPRHVVEPVNERLLRVRVERERELETLWVRDAQRLEVDGQLVLRCDRALDACEVIGWNCDGREPGVDRVLPKDVAEGGSEDNSEAVVLERPRRVLARRATPEVAARKENRNSPYPARSMRFRNCFGMIWSVSTSGRSSTATVPVTARSGLMPAPARP
jgi:hypothetical protein